MNTKAKILVADDSAFMRKVLMDILKAAGFDSFVECGTGKECIAKFETEKPDLLLLDIIMPEMTGLEVLKQIGSKANTIIISAVGQESMMTEAKQHGAKGYIVKPFEKKLVLAEVEKALG
jgi:two-component system, chemotaxis family, chemotaxis protein CheY